MLFSLFAVQSEIYAFFEVVKIPEPKALRLMFLMRVLVAFNFALEQGIPKHLRLSLL